MLSKFFGYLCIGAAIVLIIVVIYRNSLSQPGPLLFSSAQLLGATWDGYKRTYVEADTFRTLDKQRGDVTTSEGQSYTMLRAVWSGDKDTFDGAWQWTRTNLARPSDHLFAWLWGVNAKGVGGILIAQNGNNTASDADSDIALALIFAYARWQDPAYLEAARPIVTDIWEKEVVVIKGTPYLAADDLEKTARSPWIAANPSYLSPASYHLFALVDPTHPWETLRSASYDLLAKSAALEFDGKPSANLPPDWIRISRATGEINASTTTSFDARFGYDALRVPFRVALDALWFQNPEATALLKRFSFLSKDWKERGKLASVYLHDGTPAENSEAAALYGGTIGYFMLVDPPSGRVIYRKKLLSLYDPATGAWNTTLSYYDDNWVWFGIALYAHQLPNLAEDLPATAFR